MNIGDKVRVKNTEKPIMTISNINTKIIGIVPIHTIECTWYNKDEEVFISNFSDSILEVVNE